MAKPSGRAYHHDDLRGCLIAVALESIEQGGTEPLSLRQLARQAGVSPMAPYRHFKDKADLLECVARHGFGELYELFRAVDDPAAPRQTLMAFGVAYVRFAVERHGLFQLMYGGAPPTPDVEVVANPATVFGLFLARIADLVPPAERSTAFIALWSAVHGYATLLVSGRIRGTQADPAETAKRIVEIVLNGLSPQGSETARTV